MKKNLNKFLKDHENEPAKVVTKIWTSDALITQLLNFALIVDASKNFKFDKSEYEFFENYLSNFLSTKSL